MLIFVLFALAALTIDLGLVRATQRQMQSRVDSAALEGLRFRDDVSAVDATANGTPAERDLARRKVAASFVDPALQTNEATNELHGDLVAGRFIPAGTGQEAADYTRDDFTPEVTGEEFLVRLRRMNAPTALDGVAGVSSHGAGLPLVFGGATLLGADSVLRANGYTMRATAIAEARPALSVGPAYPASLYPDHAPPFAGLPGAAPFALKVSYWTRLTTDTITVNADGSLTRAAGTTDGAMVRVTSLEMALAGADTTLTVPAVVTGFPAPPFSVRIDNEILQVTFVADTTWTVKRNQQGTGSDPGAGSHLAEAPVTLHAGLTLGPALTALSSPRPTRLEGLVGVDFCTFVPLIDDASGLVAGFGKVEWSVGGYQLQVTRKPAKVAPQNASDVFTQLVSVPDAALLGPLLKANKLIADSILVPALVR